MKEGIFALKFADKDTIKLIQEQFKMNNKIIIILVVLVTVLIGVMAFQTFSPKGNVVKYEAGDAEIKLQVNIPCAGHASLIKNYLLEIEGVKNVDFKLPYYFIVSYNSTKTSQEKIVGIDVFKQYPARIIK